jgi:hypothetical protein
MNRYIAGAVGLGGFVLGRVLINAQECPLPGEKRTRCARFEDFSF